MLYVASDHHKSHLTIHVRNEGGRCVLKRKVSTRPNVVARCLSEIKEASKDEGGFVCILEECGFTLWFERMLEMYGCHKYIKIQPLKRQPQKTDHRDAARLCETLWANRERVLRGERLLDVRQVQSACELDRQARALTSEIKVLRRDRKAEVCRIHDILRRFNLTHDCPTSGLLTRPGRRWLERVELPQVDASKVRRAIEHIDFLAKQIDEVQAEIDELAAAHPAARLLTTIPGVAGLTSLAVASRIGSIERFRRPSSLANFFGLTPGINDSGEKVGSLGSITKRGSSVVRGLLAQSIYHAMRHDPQWRKWHRKLRARRGGKTAMVASMRRLACIIWHMLKTGETFHSVRNLPAPS